MAGGNNLSSRRAVCEQRTYGSVGGARRKPRAYPILFAVGLMEVVLAQFLGFGMRGQDFFQQLDLMLHLGNRVACLER